MTILSIIIITYNPGAILLDCLRSLPAAVGDLAYQVIVVDNASTDRLIQQAQTIYPHHQYILNPDNRGFSGGNNQGLVIATGDYLLLMNPDVIAEPGSLKAMVAFLESASPVGIVGPRTLNRDGQIALTAHPAYTALTVLWQYVGLDRLFPNRVYGHYREASRTAAHAFPVAWVQAHCLLLRRVVYEQTGGLDEGFFLFCEDPDLCDRAGQVGWQTHYLPGAFVRHIESSTVSRYPERRIRSYHLSPLHYFRKRGQHGQVRLLKMGFTVEMILKLLARPGRFGLHRRLINEVWGY
jgi:N-acetylglucosaminyl-diphospho-decaprenol L-rhamnosyltransferase